MKHPSRYRRVMWRITFFSFSAALLLGVALLSMYLPPADPATADLTVPDLVGQVYTADLPSLPADRFSVSVEYRTDAGVPADTVLSQTPTPGSVRRIVPGKRLCELHLVLSAGTPTLSVPNVIGLQADAAERQLRQVGLSVIRRSVSDARYAAGQVIATTPAVGATVAHGDTVTLQISATATKRTLTVPNVVGAPRSVAIAALRRVGILAQKLEYAPSDQPRDTVIAQFPLGNTIVPADCAGATLTLSDGSLYAPDEDAADQELFNEAEPDTEQMPHPSATASHESEQ
jgi:serine/threonine-protein kinase